MRDRLVRLLLLGSLALAAGPACGDGSAPAAPDAAIEPDAPSGLDEDGCRILTLGERGFQLDAFGAITGLRYPVDPQLDGTRTDFLLIELYDSTTPGGLPPLAPGTFDLSAPPDDDLGTCQHCVWVKIDERSDGTVDAIYYQTEGTLTLDRVTDPLGPIFAGSTSRVVMRRATISADGHSVLDAGGDCVSITGTSFRTDPTPGQACLSAEDCGNPLLEVCDPGLNRCVAPQCGEAVALSCPTGEICVPQYIDEFFGACYQVCDPTAVPSACDAGQRCVQFGLDAAFGVCKHVGDGAAGEACVVEDNSTSCAGKAVCSPESETCNDQCTFLDADTGCTDGTLCSLFSICEPPSSGFDIPVGAACPPDADLVDGCAPDDDAFRGICFSYDFDALRCEKACLVDQAGCSADEFCALRFSSGLGICLPLPVCGDGERGEINENCDDGNTVSGDGCSADCLTVEYDVLCAAAPPLPFGVDVAGNTFTGLDGFQNSCQAGTARAELFDVSVPGPGRLSLHIASPTNQTVAVRSDCGTSTSELPGSNGPFSGCIDVLPVRELVLQVTDAGPTSLTAVVGAGTVLEEGPFTVRADFVAESCGDGVVAGNEVCDDGNTASGDGCRVDCLAIEYDALCALAPTLSTRAPNDGDTSGAPSAFASSCDSWDGTVSGPDRLYRYVAPANGTLHLNLDDEIGGFDNLLTVAVYDGCGTPAEVTEIGCRAGFNTGEVDIALAAGQSITVVVGGFGTYAAGPYTLAATFTPQ